MTSQEIITYILIGWAFYKVAKGIYSLFVSTASSCESGGCCGCSAKTDLLKQIAHSKKVKSATDNTNHKTNLFNSLKYMNK